MKRFVFRFDIDTSPCLERGVPPLLDLARRNDVRFTFFCTMGKSVEPIKTFMRIMYQRGTPPKKAARLSTLAKLGTKQLMRIALFNPLVGRSHPDQVNMIIHQGHELGLHGGRNHGQWQREFQEWDYSRIEDEVAWGMAAFKDSTGQNPLSFAPPGWQSSTTLEEILASKGFLLCGGSHGLHASTITRRGKLHEVPTNVLGEPGGVGFIEHLAARGLDDNEILQRFRAVVQRSSHDFLVLYDHPVYVGIRRIDLLSKMVDIVREEHYSIMTMSDLIGTA